ncbi:hypothetical protein KEM48_002182 [Puccinia striiformis f. sp. tritici PST-130]|nr:hypothetical protein KEM48_002182 [Puccinia striiformis f. sp. tritici PST-130]
MDIRSSSSSRRSFYDPKQPRLLTEDEIAQMSPAECDAACLQIDQISVNILQNIDADFGKRYLGGSEVLARVLRGFC